MNAMSRRRVLVAVGLCIAGNVAFVQGAAAQVSCTGGGGSYVMAMPAKIEVPRDAPVGAMLSSWIYGPSQHRQVMTCQASPSDTPRPRMTYTGPNRTTGITVASPGGPEVSQVVETNVKGIGLAIAAQPFPIFPTCGLPWNTGVATSTPVWPIISEGACAHFGVRTDAGGQLALALVKTSDAIDVGVVQISGAIAELTILAHRFGTAAGTWQPVIYLGTDVEVAPLTCQVSDVPVDMTTVAASDFSGIGTRARQVGFAIDVQGCHAGVSAIEYELNPLTPVLDASKGVIGLDPGGATGVGLQIVDAADVPVAYRSKITVSGYTPGNDVSIPLKAAYYQTESTIGVGAADASVEFTMTYK